MPIKEGDPIPSATLTIMGQQGPQALDSRELFAQKKSVLFAVPGAFTPTCSAQHLPGFVDQQSAFKQKSVDQIICTSVNDAFVMQAWGKSYPNNEILMAADGNGDFAIKLGLSFDGSNFGMGVRSQRYAMIVQDNVVQSLFVEEGGAFDVSTAQHVLSKL